MENKPNLILLNGPLGIGKSTLADMYVQNHALALNLDIDDIWAKLGDWRKHADQSHARAMRMASALAEINLLEGSDVIVPQILRTNEQFVVFENIAKKTDATLHEILLLVDKDEATRRFIIRGQREGNPSGFRPGGIIDTGGREKRLARMYDEMREVSQERPQTKVIHPIFDDIESTYAQLIQAVS